MKKIWSILIVFLLIWISSTIIVYGEPAVIGTINGAVGAEGTWDGQYHKEANGDGLKLCYSGDAYGYQFTDIPAGVYKIAHYITVDSLDYGKYIRISPKVSYGRTELRCWINWYTADAIAKLSDVLDSDSGKIVLVSVITIPKDGANIDVGFWQHTGAYVGTLDKVMLTTADYQFEETEYVLIGEKSYDADHIYNEDPEQQLLAQKGSWVSSAEQMVTAVPELTSAPSNATPTQSTPVNIAPAFIDYLQTGLLLAIVFVFIIGVIGVFVFLFLIKKGKK